MKGFEAYNCEQAVEAIKALAGEGSVLSETDKHTIIDNLMQVRVKRYYCTGKHIKRDILVLGETHKLKEVLTACGISWDLESVKLAAVNFILFNSAFVDLYAEPVYPMKLSELLTAITSGYEASRVS